MSQTVAVDLDKPRQLRFSIFDARDVCRLLSNYPGKGHVDSFRLLQLLGGRDWDAWAEVLAQGFKHEDENLKADRALRHLTAYLEKGGDLEIVAKAIRKAGQLGRVWNEPDDADTDTTEGPVGNVSRGSRDLSP
jgi:hypothetical protein